MTIEIPGVGRARMEDYGAVTEPLHTPLLDGPCEYGILDYTPEDAPAAAACIAAFRSLDHSALAPATDAIYAYYRDTVADRGLPRPRIDSPHEVWAHVSRPAGADLQQSEGTWYVILESECAWEPEHGLALIFREGRRITRVGPHDGELTNRDAFGDPSIPEDALYWNPRRT